MIAHGGFDSPFPDDEPFFMCLLAISLSSLENSYSGPWLIFKLGYLAFLLLNCVRTCVF